MAGSYGAYGPTGMTYPTTVMPWEGKDNRLRLRAAQIDKELERTRPERMIKHADEQQQAKQQLEMEAILRKPFSGTFPGGDPNPPSIDFSRPKRRPPPPMPNNQSSLRTLTNRAGKAY